MSSPVVSLFCTKWSFKSHRRHVFRTGVLKCALGLLVINLIPINANAAEWVLEPSISVRGEYNDNIHLSRTNEKSVTGSTIIPRLKIKGLEKHWGLLLDAKLKSTQYSGEDALDGDDKYVDFSSHYETERTRWELNGAYHRDSNLNSEWEESGIVSRRIDRTRSLANPAWQWSFSERNSLRLDYNYDEVDYDDTTNTAFVDYQTHTGSLSLARQLTETDKLSLVASKTDYKSGDGTIEYDIDSAKLVLDHNFSETFSMNLSAGSRNLKSIVTRVTPTQETEEKGAIYSAGFTWKSEVTSLTTSVGRDTKASSTGGVNEEDRFDLTYSYRFSPLLKVTLRGYVMKRETINTGTTLDDRTRYLFHPALHWHINRDWSLKTSYRYIRDEFKNSTDDAESNTIYLSLTRIWHTVSSY